MNNEKREQQMMAAADAYVEESEEIYDIVEAITDFCAGWRAADQHPQWIPVEERLPEETEVVLGVREGGTDVEMYKFMGFNESTNTFDWEWHPYYRAVVDDVTHWMPIVPPRNEE